MTFSVIRGSTTFSQTFTTMAAADTYFTDQVLDFTGNTTSVTIEAVETSSTSGDGFAFDAEVGSTSLPVPEPSGKDLVLLSCGLLFWATNSLRSVARFSSRVSGEPNQGR